MPILLMGKSITPFRGSENGITIFPIRKIIKIGFVNAKMDDNTDLWHVIKSCIK